MSSRPKHNQQSGDLALFATSLFALACGAIVASKIDPRKMTDYVITKTAGAVTTVAYLMDDLSKGRPRRGFLERKLRDYQQYSDEAAAARSMQRKVIAFDDCFPIQSSTILRLTAGACTADFVLKGAFRLGILVW